MVGKTVQCYLCGGKGWAIPVPAADEVVFWPKKPRECRLCNGTGFLEVQK